MSTEAGCPHQTPKVGQRGNCGKILQIAFEISADVAVEPDRPVGGLSQVYGGRRESPSASQPATVIGLVGLGGK